MRNFTILCIALLYVIIPACGPKADRAYQEQLQERIAQYSEVTLEVDLSHLEDWEIELIPLLFEAADVIDEIFWLQAYGPKDHLMEFMQDPYAREYALINYGPWGRLEGHTPFYRGFEDKALGANFYPLDINREEFNEWEDATKRHPLTMIRRTADGKLVSIPYAEAFASQNEQLSDILTRAAGVSRYQPMSEFLSLRAKAFKSDDFEPSELAWMNMRENRLELIIGPLDTGEDRKFGHKKAHSAYILLKDPESSRRLERFAGMLPQWQAALPVPAEFKSQVPEMNAQLFVYDALYYAGHCNAGPKIIALNLPSDRDIREITGSRNMQIRNVMEAKFNEILHPISRLLIHEDQADMVDFDSFFHLTALHEMAGSLGVSHTVTDGREVRNALQETHGTIDAALSDLLSLFLIMQLQREGEFTEDQLKSALVTSAASIMRSSRFGTAGAHGVAAMMRFNHFTRTGALIRDETTNTYRVDFDKMQQAIEEGIERLMRIQGEGNYAVARSMISEDGQMTQQLQDDLKRIGEEGIPVDVMFRQGLSVLDLD